MGNTQATRRDEQPLQGGEAAGFETESRWHGIGTRERAEATLRRAAISNEETMNEQPLSIEGKTSASSEAVAPERDVFLELWAAEMLVRRRLGELVGEFVSDARRLVYSEIGAANARATLMLAAVFACVGVMISLLEQVMPAWSAALVTSGVMATLGFALLQERWVAGAVGVVRNVRREMSRRELARVRIGSR
jgi:hypothetical protein